MRFDLVIFDLDGTLVDSAPDLANAVARTFAEIGVAAPDVAAIRTMVGDGAAKLLERALPPSESGRDVAPLVSRFREHYAQHLCDETRVYDGVPALLVQLAEAGVPMAVLTNKPAEHARRLLDAMSLADRFAAIVGDGDGFPRKPDPAAARALMARFAITPARTLMVGDGLPDVRMARALGCPVVAVTWGYTSAAALAAELPTALADTPAQVSELVRG